LKAALVEMLSVYVLMLYLFQPTMHDIYTTRAHAVEMVLDSGIQKAASEDYGCFTPEIIQGMSDTLVQTFLLDPSTITFTGTTILTPRGEYIEGKLAVKSTPRWLFDRMFGAPDQDSKLIVRYAKQMSEALVR
jgi:hypothetical protein